MENRNGIPYILGIEASGFQDKFMYLTSVGASGRWLRGGLMIDTESFKKLAQKFLVELEKIEAANTPS